eukprot:Lithocolla_globosa_v1_NODE_6383_length_1095_cov_5.152885.p3 type:complete len:131 gc:universal NODE_6383_length_1095_cov_5.152885:414-806(+)
MVPDIQELVNHLNDVDADSVVFNWECCGACSEKGFPKNSNVLALVKWLLDNGHMCMFSDFSLKALIHEWDNPILGPNPFVRRGSFDENFQLGFNAQALVDCPSQQLQQVGELCPKGECGVSAAAVSDVMS